MATQQHSVFPFSEQHKLCFCRLAHESLQIWQPCNHSDFSCPICLQTATLPVETNCGHLFCGSCLITYWKHSPWLAAITCPLCRQKVVLLDSISCEKKHDKPSKQIVHDIRDYNKRFSGQPRPFADYLYDMPLFLTLALRGIFTWGVLVWLFFLRVAVCSFGTIICLSSPFEMKPGPLCRTLGTADDMVVVSLLLICTINICQQIAPNGVSMARSAAQSMLSEA
ncbi:E3 ubiquitin-protein ligase RNF170-like isoform X1 [Lathamus discolor]|uniref:E3 ubiquitin-protein ligase RNF170-like isoform X1 n=1 Tax=Lathamus discolor TaxID=678569 RepID=UPI0032B76E35